MATKNTTAKDNVTENTKEITKKTVSKKEMKTTLFVEYREKQVEDKTMIAAAKKAWANAGHKISDIKTLELYVKPEEEAIYYVINKTESGKVEF